MLEPRGDLSLSGHRDSFPTWRPCTGNEVSSLEGLGPLPSLRRLEVTGNKLTSTAGLAHLPAAHELLLVSGPRVNGDADVVVWGPFRKAGRCCCG